MISLLAYAALWQSTGTIERDAFHVPICKASSEIDLYRLQGRAIAMDRLWQIEMSRRSAQGQLAEVMGPSAVASDTEVLQTLFTPKEFQELFSQIDPQTQAYWKAYAEGINEVIQERKSTGTLPPQYAELGFEPRPWTVTDSCAIAVKMSRMFGAGGAGELRNYALFQYLKMRANLKGKLYDVMDDLAWQNDENSIPTVLASDDPIDQPPSFPDPTRAQSIAHVESLPPTSIFELAGAIRLSIGSESTLMAESLAVPYKVGSYCIVVGKDRSATGNALLLNGPQMGHTSPSIIHEVAFDSPDIKVAGMDVPGVPGIVVGYTPQLAWGVTSGVADIEDIFVSTLVGDGKYLSSGQELKLEEIPFTLKVKGAEDKTVIQQRTLHGPVLLVSSGSNAVYSQKSAYWKKELTSFTSLSHVYRAKSVEDIDEFVDDLDVTFNFFFAFKNGDIGYRYLGRVPVRSANIDPRFPVPDSEENQWQGFIPANKMPRVDNPKNGLIVNWNNKPVAWWPNLDTPVWGSIFRNEIILKSLPRGSLTVGDLERAIWTIARSDTRTNGAFLDDYRRALSGVIDRPDVASQIMADDGSTLAGSIPARMTSELFDELRHQIFLPVLGNFLNDSIFRQVVQPSFVQEALAGRTKFDYLGDKSVDEWIRASYQALIAKDELPEMLKEGLRIGTIPGNPALPDNLERIPYGDRGTYIQITELGRRMQARSVASPGITESGEWAYSQAPLARDWRYKTLYSWE